MGEGESEEQQEGGGRRGKGYHLLSKRLRTDKDGKEEEEEERMAKDEAAEESGAGGEVVFVEPMRVLLQDIMEDTRSIAPSPVVHVRGLCAAAVEVDLVEALGKFGKICYVKMMPFKHQALVEFDCVNSAEHCVSHGTHKAVNVAEQPVFLNFSTSHTIKRPINACDPDGRNKVLLLSIQNPLYPITTDLLFRVCNPIRAVQRIVILRRNRVQAMVEFQSMLDAQKVKLALNGADIYTGCCTLHIQYARPKRLNVVCNDSSSSWDYTEHFQLNSGPRCRPLLSLPSYSRISSKEALGPSFFCSSLLELPCGSTSSSVVMVSGLHPTLMNCSRIFNLFCLYGNVGQVKFMRSSPGTALVEMGDMHAVDRAVTHLNSIVVFGKKLSVCVSKQRSVIPTQVFTLADGSSSSRNFSQSRNNRFSAAHSSRTVIQSPTTILHFYNAPATFSPLQLQKLCGDHSAPSFSRFRVFDSKLSSQTLSGLLQFDSRSSAVETLIILNHHELRHQKSSAPFTLKLCFSTSTRL